MKKIDAAGGVLYRKRKSFLEVLLIFRRKVWDLPKGKREVGESFEICAVREVEEETGAVLPALEAFLIETFHEYEENNTRIEKKTRWYAMQPSDPGFAPVPQTSEGIEATEWVELGEARERVGFDNLVRVLDAFETMISA